MTSVDTGCWWLPTWVSCPCHQSTGLYLIYQYPVSELPACFQTVQKIPPLTSKVDRMVPGEPWCPVAQAEILLNCSEKERKYKCLGKIYCSNRLLWRNYISKDTYFKYEVQYDHIQIEDIKSDVGVIKYHEMVAWNLFYCQMRK